MSDKKRHLNPLLLLIAILLCLSAGFLFRRTSFDANYKIPARHSSVIKNPRSHQHLFPPRNQRQTSAFLLHRPLRSSLLSLLLNPISQDETSPEASLGVWTSSGSNWMFMVDGVPYTGWLIDTDGKHYFFDKDGIMQTGWVDGNGKRYYMDLDGIMQTGTITVDDQIMNYRQTVL